MTKESGSIHLPIQKILWPPSSNVKWMVCEANYSPPLNAEVKMYGAIPPLPICLHGVVLN
jgi:hypothetical protein